MSNMARQEFKQGEVVMLHSYGDSWKPAVVVNPDIPKRQSRWNATDATVHDVMVWVNDQWMTRGYRVAPRFRTHTLRNNRSAILGLTEYENTVVVKVSAKRAAREERDRQDEADEKAGLEMAYQDVLEAKVGESLKRVLRLWINDYTLQREGRVARKLNEARAREEGS